ncbi:hypothetical protein MTP03_09560 [Tsukamurella sp. PLM1]|nr:hypothetical protein MTP03_09560 [Tsukamurella sp. PLM1]
MDRVLSVVPSSLTVRAPAKVNLHLGVGDVRPDGYHELITVFQALSLHDDVTLTPSDALALHVSGEGARDVPTDPTNLAARAVVALAERYGRDASLRIDIAKGIPVAGGMAGGSADAAAALLGAATLWGLDIGRDELDEVAATLGSDVPFSLHGHTALGTGRGERLIPALARGEFHWALALAREGLSTPAVYRELDYLREVGDPPRAGSPDALLAAVASGDPHRLAPLLANDLQAAALSLQPACGARCGPEWRRVHSPASSPAVAPPARSSARTPTMPWTWAPSSRAAASAGRCGWPPARCRAPPSYRRRDPHPSRNRGRRGLAVYPPGVYIRFRYPLGVP